MPTRRITLDRTFPATAADLWELWTTPPGIEAWWGPIGFAVSVRSLDLRAGGTLRYGMTAVDPEMVAFMDRAGMPRTTESTITFTEVTPPRRLAYSHVVDFVPGHAPYDVAHLVEIDPVAEGVRLRLTIDAMHDEVWTQRAVQGWEQELGKLAAVIAARK